MKKLCLLVGLAGVFAVTAAQAQLQVTLYQDTSNYSYGDGGEFNAVPNAALLSLNPTLNGYVAATADPTAASPNFQTFCVETMSYFSPGNTYNVTISQTLYNGGQFPTGEALTMGTAWLYGQFAAGTLDGVSEPYDYTYGSGRVATAGDLQQAIWYLQGEQPLIGNGANGTAFYDAALAALGGNINNPSDGAFGVVVLNLWVPNPDDSNGAASQDQLMVVPEPDGLSFGLLFLLTLGMHKVRAHLRGGHSQ
jgi:hypothetical protein